MIKRMKEKYKEEVLPEMKKTFGFKNDFEVPKIEKVVLNTGFGKMIIGKTSQEQKKIIDAILNDLAMISGQRPSLTKARKSISSFKLRKGMPIGAKCTLRGQRMYDFLDRLVHIALPRTRDFKGLSLKSIDEKGNLTIGIKEHIVFPEISPEKVKVNFGFEITVVTTAKNREEAKKLFELLGFPFKKND